eukprot:875793_1
MNLERHAFHKCTELNAMIKSSYMSKRRDGVVDKCSLISKHCGYPSRHHREKNGPIIDNNDKGSTSPTYFHTPVTASNSQPPVPRSPPRLRRIDDRDDGTDAEVFPRFLAVPNALHVRLDHDGGRPYSSPFFDRPPSLRLPATSR